MSASGCCFLEFHGSVIKDTWILHPFFILKILQIMLPSAPVCIDAYLIGGKIPVDRLSVSLTCDRIHNSGNRICYIHLKIVLPVISKRVIFS